MQLIVCFSEMFIIAYIASLLEGYVCDIRVGWSCFFV